MAKRAIMSEGIEQMRAEKMAAPHPCYDGQWTVHESHAYELRVQTWLGGGTEQVTCPGVKEGERFQDRYPHNS
jgi:hypothetical protein